MTDEQASPARAAGVMPNSRSSCSSADARASFSAHLDLVPRTKGFGNGRYVRNVFEALVTAQASRLVDGPKPTAEQLCQLTSADLAVALAAMHPEGSVTS